MERVDERNKDIVLECKRYPGGSEKRIFGMAARRIAGYPMPAGNQGQPGYFNERAAGTGRLPNLLELPGKKGVFRGSDFYKGKTYKNTKHFRDKNV
jgi:hypothetical protein